MTAAFIIPCREHKIIAKEIRNFLGTSEGDIQNGYSETAAKKDQ